MIKKLFEEAFRLWNNRAVDERPTRRTPVFRHFRQELEPEIKRTIRNLGFGEFTVKASVGMGNYAAIPWVGIRHDTAAEGFQQGVYVVYLFSPDFQKLYLSINQGVTNLRVNVLQQRATELRDKISRPEDFSNDIADPLTRDQSLNSKPDKYQKGSIYTTTYELARIPDDNDLGDDLKAALESYQRYIDGVVGAPKRGYPTRQHVDKTIRESGKDKIGKAEFLARLERIMNKEEITLEKDWKDKTWENVRKWAAEFVGKED